MELSKCNVAKCLRRDKVWGLEYCDAESFAKYKNLDEIIPDSKKCPFYCSKFKDYKTGKIVKKFEDTGFISMYVCTDEEREMYKIPKDIKFTGLSKEGHDIMENQRDARDKYDRKSEIICPFCDNKIIDTFSGDNFTNNAECINCGSKITVHVVTRKEYYTSHNII